MENEETKEKTVKRDDDKPVKFAGERIAHTTTDQGNYHTNTEASIFKTQGGKYIYAEEYTTDYGPGRFNYRVHVYKTLDELFMVERSNSIAYEDVRNINYILKPLAKQVNYDLDKKTE